MQPARRRISLALVPLTSGAVQALDPGNRRAESLKLAFAQGHRPELLYPLLDQLENLIEAADGLIIAAKDGIGNATDKRLDRTIAMARDQIIGLVFPTRVGVHGAVV